MRSVIAAALLLGFVCAAHVGSARAWAAVSTFDAVDASFVFDPVACCAEYLPASTGWVSSAARMEIGIVTDVTMVADSVEHHAVIRVRLGTEHPSNGETADDEEQTDGADDERPEPRADYRAKSMVPPANCRHFARCGDAASITARGRLAIAALSLQVSHVRLQI